MDTIVKVPAASTMEAANSQGLFRLAYKHTPSAVCAFVVACERRRAVLESGDKTPNQGTALVECAPGTPLSSPSHPVSSHSSRRMDTPTDLLDSLQEIFACGIVGYAIATTIYGITVLQTYMYFRRYPRDRPSLKAFTPGYRILDTLTTVLMSHALYAFFVLNLKDLVRDVDLPWSFTLENGVTDLITAMVQCYFAERLWRLKVFSNHNLLSDTFRKSLVLGGAVQGVAVLGDILITGGLCYYLTTNKGGHGRIDTLLNKLIAYAVERGVLTAVQTLYLIMSVAFPERFYFVPFAMIVAKMYVNTLLAR
ncbi:hypothetical protein OH76DRAFT_528123 [Lentinus brumalis]|uniref:DUF6534 domain-containing protein n=1 Tax=Lentinus brumalis TaxID=2498619 RepID=A0A371DA38_9APHY|nr:hypothetical protein OH76DRAFT_528123 [Polyporus brumalis]